jgi:hypothetical protein
MIPDIAMKPPHMQRNCESVILLGPLDFWKAQLTMMHDTRLFGSVFLGKTNILAKVGLPGEADLAGVGIVGALGGGTFGGDGLLAATRCSSTPSSLPPGTAIDDIECG